MNQTDTKCRCGGDLWSYDGVGFECVECHDQYAYPLVHTGYDKPEPQPCEIVKGRVVFPDTVHPKPRSFELKVLAVSALLWGVIGYLIYTLSQGA